MNAICAGLAFWFSVLVITPTPTLDATLNTPTAAAWSSR